MDDNKELVALAGKLVRTNFAPQVCRCGEREVLVSL